MLNYSIKAKCQGCHALQKNGKEFSCGFGLPLITDEDAGGAQSSPQPNEVKCYKPRNVQQWRDARKMMKEKGILA